MNVKNSLQNPEKNGRFEGGGGFVEKKFLGFEGGGICRKFFLQNFTKLKKNNLSFFSISDSSQSKNSNY